MADWRSYDAVAHRYDQVWGARFREVAAGVAELMPRPPGARVLDVGTGTGIVAEALAPAGAVLAGCDRSREMLLRARARVPGLSAAVADATALPFRSGTFDAVTACFVLSHVREHGRALREAHRVLAPGGRVAIASWAAISDPAAAIWSEALAAEVAPFALQEAAREVVPAEGEFEQEDAVARALRDAGFTDVTVHERMVRASLTIDEYLADRELSSGGRFARTRLSPERFAGMMERTRARLSARFGERFDYERGALIGLGRKGES